MELPSRSISSAWGGSQPSALEKNSTPTSTNRTDSASKPPRVIKPMSSIVENALGPAPDLPINPSDWSYLAEGGFHIILRYDGTDPEIAGRILRIGKKSLGHTHEADGEAGGGDAAVAAAAASAAAATAPDEAGARRKFERGVLMPLLGTHYVQPGDAVTLSRGDIDKIHHRCGVRLSARLRLQLPLFRCP